MMFTLQARLLATTKHKAGEFQGKATTVTYYSPYQVHTTVTYYTAKRRPYHLVLSNHESQDLSLHRLNFMP